MRTRPGPRRSTAIEPRGANPLLTPAKSYQEVQAQFRWRVPARDNIGRDVCDKWAGEADRLALIHKTASGPRGARVERYSFRELKRLSNQLANGLAARGLSRGDRVGILLSQGPETAIAHIATYKLGAIAVPLFTLFGVDALRYRLQDSGAKALVTDAEGIAKLAEIRAELPALALVYCIDGPVEGALSFHAELAAARDSFAVVDTAAEDPALIIYTSGTTGPPKGALHAQRVVLGHLPGSRCPTSFFRNRGIFSGPRRTGPGSAA